MDVIITDHHDLPETLPDAYAITQPAACCPRATRSPGCRGWGWPTSWPKRCTSRAGRAEEAESFLDLVALGIVADLALQTGDTRYLLQRGLRVLRADAGAPGWR